MTMGIRPACFAVMAKVRPQMPAPDMMIFMQEGKYKGIIILELIMMVTHV
jgi:hypothetical protein